MIPIHAREVQDLYYQMQFLLKNRGVPEQVLKPITVRNTMAASGMIQPDEMEAMLDSLRVIERVS
jgi:hypothetical protein